MKTSEFLKLDLGDLLKGAIVALGAFLLNYLQTTFVPNLDVSTEVKTLIFAGLAYLSKNLFTTSKEIHSVSNIGLPRPRDPRP